MSLRTSPSLVLLLAAVLHPAGSAAQTTHGYTPEECSSCAVWNRAHEAVRIFGNSYWVGTEGLGSILITSTQGHILIDGALPESAALIEQNIRSLGFRIEDVRLILNSHAHFDHAGGLAWLQEKSGAEVAVVAHHTGGHTPGGTTWSWISCEDQRCLSVVYADSQTPISADGFLFSSNAAYARAVEDFRLGAAPGAGARGSGPPHGGVSWPRVVLPHAVEGEARRHRIQPVPVGLGGGSFRKLGGDALHAWCQGGCDEPTGTPPLSVRL